MQGPDHEGHRPRTPLLHRPQHFYRTQRGAQNRGNPTALIEARLRRFRPADQREVMFISFALRIVVRPTLRCAEALPNEGRPEDVFGAPHERLTIRHDANSAAASYVTGTLLAARRVGDQSGCDAASIRLLAGPD